MSRVSVRRIAGQAIADWPKLLHLYSRLKPGKTVFEWMQEYDVQSYNLDVRRFTSFGVIKVGLSLSYDSVMIILIVLPGLSSSSTSLACTASRDDKHPSK